MSFAYLDIETCWKGTITVIGVYRQGHGTVQLVAPRISREALHEALEGVTTIFTYNGARFDLPVIARWLNTQLLDRHGHRDLMHDCWRSNLRGGLKAVERRLGIHRDTEGVDGIQAMKLWETHKRCRQSRCAADGADAFSSPSCCEALELLLRYNREDCENLEVLARKLSVIESDALSA